MPTTQRTVATWPVILTALLGLWTLFSPYVFGTATTLLANQRGFFWSTTLASLSIVILAGYTAYRLSLTE